MTNTVASAHAHLTQITHWCADPSHSSWVLFDPNNGWTESYACHAGDDFADDIRWSLITMFATQYTLDLLMTRGRS